MTKTKLLSTVITFCAVSGLISCSPAKVETSPKAQVEEVIAPSLPANMTLVSQDEIRAGYKKHAAMAQFHRWYLLYENQAVTMENQLDVLADDIYLKSGLGEANGHDDYVKRIADIPKTWKNAHFVKDAEITVNEDGTAALLAHITYLNEGALPKGKVRSAELTYNGVLKPKATKELLPEFSSLEIVGTSDGVTDSFKDAYPLNRVTSLTHYWLAAIEDPSRDVTPFKEMLSNEGFTLNFSSGKITDIEAFEKWLTGPAAAVEASTHKIKNLNYETLDENSYKVNVDFDWQGILPNGAEMIAQTRHMWVVEDNPEERFPRIKTVDVEILTPFMPRP